MILKYESFTFVLYRKNEINLNFNYSTWHESIFAMTPTCHVFRQFFQPASVLWVMFEVFQILVITRCFVGFLQV